MSKPEIALLVSTYQRPAHLERALASIALQKGVTDEMEVIVTDDGSVDETSSIVQRFADSAPFPVKFTTHPHETFQLSRCRNEGVAASEAPYLLFLDGDCILPPDHVRIHLERRRPNTVMAGACLRLEKEASDKVTVESTNRLQAPTGAVPSIYTDVATTPLEIEVSGSRRHFELRIRKPR